MKNENKVFLTTSGSHHDKDNSRISLQDKSLTKSRTKLQPTNMTKNSAFAVDRNLPIENMIKPKRMTCINSLVINDSVQMIESVRLTEEMIGRNSNKHCQQPLFQR